jgi:hypothetical protein
MYTRGDGSSTSGDHIDLNAAGTPFHINPVGVGNYHYFLVVLLPDGKVHCIDL